MSHTEGSGLAGSNSEPARAHTKSAQPPHNNRPDNQVSNCHQAPLITVRADEGTCYYECRKCNQPCDPMTDNQADWLHNLLASLQYEPGQTHLERSAAENKAHQAITTKIAEERLEEFNMFALRAVHADISAKSKDHAIFWAKFVEGNAKRFRELEAEINQGEA